jgi:8-oxo-dGTP diphosphatase
MGAKRRGSAVLPRRPQIGVACLVTRDGKYLLLRRRGSHGHGSWCPPGGHLDWGENVETCAAREVREETGLTVRDIRFLGITNDVFETEDRHYVTLWTTAEAPEGEPSVAAPHEMDEIGWFAPDDLPAPLFLSLRNLLGGDLQGGSGIRLPT